MWSDDFHHTARVALTGRYEAYYSDYRGTAQELISVVKRGFLYQGQQYQWQNQPRGSVVTSEPAQAFVFYLQNHDQVANRLWGERIHTLTSPAQYRAAAALMLLAPETPMLFMGQEFGASSPFLFFANHKEDLAPVIYRGRKEFLSQCPGRRAALDSLPDPSNASTFECCKLDCAERQQRADIDRFPQDLLRLRRDDPVIAAQARDRLDGAVLGPEALVIRFWGIEGMIDC